MNSHHHLMPQFHNDEEEQEAQAPELSLAQEYARAIRAELAKLSVEGRRLFCEGWLARLDSNHPAYEMRDELTRQMS